VKSVAKIERAAADVSLDQLVRAFTAAGGKVIVRTTTRKAKPIGSKKSVRAVGQIVLEVETSE
jgi:hypothetical protein